MLNTVYNGWSMVSVPDRLPPRAGRPVGQQGLQRRADLQRHTGTCLTRVKHVPDSCLTRVKYVPNIQVSKRTKMS